MTHAETPERRLMVVGTGDAYALYLRNFLHTPATAPRLDSAHKLRGANPDRLVLILLPGWERGIKGAAGLWTAVDDYRFRFRQWGTEEITEAELLGGIPVRKDTLLQRYDDLVEKASRNGLAWDLARKWVSRLDPRDASILSWALDARKAAKKEAEKIPCTRKGIDITL